MSMLLDTNVVSELMGESPEPSVARWVSGPSRGGPVPVGRE